jgi:hypothetical protein
MSSAPTTCVASPLDEEGQPWWGSGMTLACQVNMPGRLGIAATRPLTCSFTSRLRESNPGPTHYECVALAY